MTPKDKELIDTINKQFDRDNEVDVMEKIAVKHDTKVPDFYNVIYMNDDKTPFDFVIESLIHIFGHTPDKAGELTIEVHEAGKAIVATLGYEMAEQKAHEVKQMARINQYPLNVRVVKA